MPLSIFTRPARAETWFESRLPEPLLREGPAGVLWWQWIAVPIAVVLALALGRALGLLTRRIAGPLLARTGMGWDRELLSRLAAPVTWLWTFAVAYLLEGWLGLSESAELRVGRVLLGGATLAVLWGVLRAVDLFFSALVRSPWAAGRADGQAMLGVTRKVSKVAVAAVGAMVVLSLLGFNVTGIVAGLGIGGLALALGAQKTLENLIGSIAIGIDQPFRIGDFIKVGDMQGDVESVGLRSTRVRTLDRTLVTVPNGKLADERIETFAARDRFRLACSLSLVYSTTSAQVREVLAGLESVLREHPLIWPDVVRVRLVALAASALEVEVMAWFRVADVHEFTAVRQEVLLAFMEVVERAGTTFAFPTQTVHLARPAQER